MMRISRRPQEPLDHGDFDLLLPRQDETALPKARQDLLEEALWAEVHRTALCAPRSLARRTAWIALPAATAVIAGAVIVAPGSSGTSGTDTRPPKAGAKLQPGTSKGLSATVDRISLAAARQPALEPRQDQYIYVESKVTGGRVDRAGGKEKLAVTPLHSRQVWHSPDGLKSFIYEPGHEFMDKNGEDLDLERADDVTDRGSYNSVKALPTDPDVLLKRLYQGGRMGDPQADWTAFGEIGQLLEEQIAAPKISAALFKAAAKIPGVTLVDKAADATGRPGVAITFTGPESRQEWIFDRNTYAYLGQRDVLVKPYRGLEPGAVTYETVVIKRAVVDAKKELPDGTTL
ncbi:CU044_5270 family protein [Streptomyces roseifaciens]|uniref:CU044_5270 family protein n=1 Tax=Streptomyces roseifaciens TaxID=1488406 RepID=UPI000ADBD81E|nr:CU044_5270 family protein [Streptomyces roseifaciens]